MLIQFLFILFAGFGDYYSTKFALKNGCVEANPIMRYIINKYGWNGIVIIKILFIIYALINFTYGGLIMATTIFFIITIWNILNACDFKISSCLALLGLK